MRKLTLVLLFSTLIVVALALLSPYTSGKSANPCSSCHGAYYQYLDILEEDSTNQIPLAINLSETKMVSVVIENSVNTERYSTISGVTVTLSSLYGHFSVSSPTVSLDDMPPGKRTASWQIIGISDGFDYISISGSGNNPHSGFFSDSYSPYPLITVGNATGTPPSPPSTTTPSNPSNSNPNTVPSPTVSPGATSSPAPADSPKPASSSSLSNQSLSIRLISPAGGEKWLTQTVHDIEWNASGGTAPLSITLEYRRSAIEQWTTIVTNMPDNGSLTWSTPELAATYDIRVTVNDSATPSLTALTANTFEVFQAQTNSELPLLPLTTVTLSVVVVGAVLAVYKKKLGKQKKAQKISPY